MKAKVNNMNTSFSQIIENIDDKLRKKLDKYSFHQHSEMDLLTQEEEKKEKEKAEKQEKSIKERMKNIIEDKKNEDEKVQTEKPSPKKKKLTVNKAKEEK